MTTTLSFAGDSHKGLVRENNEDEWKALSACGLFVVADGMGGHNAGEVASHEAVKYLATCVEEYFLSKDPVSHTILSPIALAEYLRRAMHETNWWVYRLGHTKSAFRGMGTTLSCFLMTGDKGIIAHVGDSRIYRLRDGLLEQLTIDHSLKQSELKKPKNILTMAIGTSSHLSPQIDIVSLQPHDVYLLCSDGLSDLVPSEEIQSILENGKMVEEQVTELIERANTRGGFDNITVLAIQLHEKTPNLFRQQRDYATRSSDHSAPSPLVESPL